MAEPDLAFDLLLRTFPLTFLQPFGFTHLQLHLSRPVSQLALNPCSTPSNLPVSDSRLCQGYAEWHKSGILGIGHALSLHLNERNVMTNIATIFHTLLSLGTALLSLCATTTMSDVCVLCVFLSFLRLSATRHGSSLLPRTPKPLGRTQRQGAIRQLYHAEKLHEAHLGLREGEMKCQESKRASWPKCAKPKYADKCPVKAAGRCRVRCKFSRRIHPAELKPSFTDLKSRNELKSVPSLSPVLNSSPALMDLSFE
ncbi:hypothetical protein B0H16DRAFT_1787983 [Mycena metata]|uniref:Uncharacterized protein n=1 Tax=Mycena metata TaxID=1033252 RepID=A0AAD7HLI2_9AGAR|nr:hypothetical protein B0H16DRAFT_1787983 [Mycena metata]